MAHTLYTHCGILSISANGHTYYAQPPLSDGQGNPPPGWNNPFDTGTLAMIDAHTMWFSDAVGHVATFTDTPAGPSVFVKNSRRVDLPWASIVRNQPPAMAIVWI